LVDGLTGTLVLAATPIGNLSDMSTRLTNLLRSADCIYCEDTRHSQSLLMAARCGARTNVFSYHTHSGLGVRAHITERLNAGDTILYITDAGTPAISDPGHELVALAYSIGAKVDVLPGPSAVTTARK
jgi:16S rRNA (cytidine1402-2'-O)-methyltransferase